MRPAVFLAANAEIAIDDNRPNATRRVVRRVRTACCRTVLCVPGGRRRSDQDATQDAPGALSLSSNSY